MSDKKGGGARLADHRCYGLMVAAAYGVVSITITLFNKAVFNFYEFKFPLTLFVAQMLFSLVFVSLPPRPPAPALPPFPQRPPRAPAPGSAARASDLWRAVVARTHGGRSSSSRLPSPRSTASRGPQAYILKSCRKSSACSKSPRALAFEMLRQWPCRARCGQ